MDAESERELIDLQNLQLRATLDPQQLVATVTGGVGNGGRIDARLTTATPLADDGALDGNLTLSLPDLTVLELVTDQVVAPSGTLDANVAIAGTRASPQIEGRASVAGFSGEVPAAGLLLSDGELVLTSAGARAATLAGTVKSGDGTLRIEGRVDGNAGAEETVRVALQGENLTIVKIPEAEARVSPDLTIVLANEQLRLRGTVTVPFARIDLEQLQGTTKASSDVVVIDAQTDEGAGLGLDSDISIVLGDDVRLNGFGLKSKLDGQLAVRDRPGRATLGAGAIQVGGAYKAYGQDLTITRGRLSFASTPIDNPAIDLRAERKIDEVTVGVQVRGTALAPELTLWSEPSMEQAEQLSYLVLGRPLRSASQADGAQLSQAAAAFGGNFLAKRLGARMGLDEVGVADNRALGGAALTVGKFLSPRLYVSYGVALFGSGQVVTFKYILSRLWSVQIDSGTENRAALNYRLER
nr:translocation/assembly module TamB domain-containing protein [Chiayiivirga flava]